MSFMVPKSKRGYKGKALSSAHRKKISEGLIKFHKSQGSVGHGDMLGKVAKYSSKNHGEKYEHHKQSAKRVIRQLNHMRKTGSSRIDIKDLQGQLARHRELMAKHKGK